MTEIVAVVMDETEFEFILYLKKGYNQQHRITSCGGSQVGNPISCRNIGQFIKPDFRWISKQN